MLGGAWAKLLKPCGADDVVKKKAGLVPSTGPNLSKVAKLEKADERKMKQVEKAKEKGVDVAPKRDLSKAEKMKIQADAKVAKIEKAAQREAEKKEREEQKAEKAAHPKAPQSAYFLFSAEMRPKVAEENPEAKGVTEVAKVCNAIDGRSADGHITATAHTPLCAPLAPLVHYGSRRIASCGRLCVLAAAWCCVEARVR